MSAASSPLFAHLFRARSLAARRVRSSPPRPCPSSPLFGSTEHVDVLGTLPGGQLRPNSPCRAPLHSTSSSPETVACLLLRIAAHRATLVRAQPLLAESRACPAPALPMFRPAAAPRSRCRRSPAALLRRATYLASPHIHLPPPPLASPAPLLRIAPPARSRPAPLDLSRAHALCCCPLLRAAVVLPRPRTAPPLATIAKCRHPPLYTASAAPYSRARHPALAALATLFRPGPPCWPLVPRRPHAPTVAPEPLPLAGAPLRPGDAALGLAPSGTRARAQ